MPGNKHTTHSVRYPTHNPQCPVPNTQPTVSGTQHTTYSVRYLILNLQCLEPDTQPTVSGTWNTTVSVRYLTLNLHSLVFNTQPATVSRILNAVLTLNTECDQIHPNFVIELITPYNWSTTKIGWSTLLLGSLHPVWSTFTITCGMKCCTYYSYKPTTTTTKMEEKNKLQLCTCYKW